LRRHLRGHESTRPVDHVDASGSRECLGNAGGARVGRMKGKSVCGLDARLRCSSGVLDETTQGQVGGFALVRARGRTCLRSMGCARTTRSRLLPPFPPDPGDRSAASLFRDSIKPMGRLIRLRLNRRARSPAMTPDIPYSSHQSGTRTNPSLQYRTSTRTEAKPTTDPSPPRHVFSSSFRDHNLACTGFPS